MFSELAGGRSKPAAFQRKIVFRIAVKIATQSADFSFKALRDVYLDKPVAIPLYLNTDVGQQSDGEATFRYLKLGKMVVR